MKNSRAITIVKARQAVSMIDNVCLAVVTFFSLLLALGFLFFVMRKITSLLGVTL